MRTNIDIDDQKMSQLMELGKFKTKKEAVDSAITEQIRFYNNLKFIEMVKNSKEPIWEGDLEQMRSYDKWEVNG